MSNKQQPQQPGKLPPQEIQPRDGAQRQQNQQQWEQEDQQQKQRQQEQRQQEQQQWDEATRVRQALGLTDEDVVEAMRKATIWAGENAVS